MVYEDYNYMPGSLATSAPILKLGHIFIFQISRFIHNCLNSNIISNFQNWFKLNNEIHITTTPDQIIKLHRILILQTAYLYQKLEQQTMG